MTQARRSLRLWLRRVPTAAYVCALVACLNATAWSIITPPFEVIDEPEHVAYVKQLAETGRLPTKQGAFSLEERLALEGTRLQVVAERPQSQPIASRAQEDRLQADLRDGQRSPQRGSEFAGVAAAQPPLYYALEAIPYTIARSGTLLDRIELMRLLSALMGGLTAFFTFMFVREALPGRPWAWSVGGLCVALAPLLGFMSGAVNPDAMLYAVTSALFFALARGFRRGVTPAQTIAIGALIAIGLATKLNFLGIAPGALLGLIVLGARSARSLGRSAYVALVVALAIALTPPIIYLIVHAGSGGPSLGIVSGTQYATHGSLWRELSYIWQLYVAKLPGMHSAFGDLMPARQLWFRGYVGLYGWLDTTFPAWVYECALVAAGAIAILCARALVGRARALRARAVELAVYAAICVGLLLLIGITSYRTSAAVNTEYAQARYLLPLLPLLGVVLALAARGAGRRWGPGVGAGIVMLFLAHDLFSQLQVVARFYG